MSPDQIPPGATPVSTPPTTVKVEHRTFQQLVTKINFGFAVRSAVRHWVAPKVLGSYFRTLKPTHGKIPVTGRLLDRYTDRFLECALDVIGPNSMRYDINQAASYMSRVAWPVPSTADLTVTVGTITGERIVCRVIGAGKNATIAFPTTTRPGSDPGGKGTLTKALPFCVFTHKKSHKGPKLAKYIVPANPASISYGDFRNHRHREAAEGGNIVLLEILRTIEWSGKPKFNAPAMRKLTIDRKHNSVCFADNVLETLLTHFYDAISGLKDLHEVLDFQGDLDADEKRLACCDDVHSELSFEFDKRADNLACTWSYVDQILREDPLLDLTGATLPWTGNPKSMEKSKLCSPDWRLRTQVRQAEYFKQPGVVKSKVIRAPNCLFDAFLKQIPNHFKTVFKKKRPHKILPQHVNVTQPNECDLEPADTSSREAPSQPRRNLAKSAWLLVLKNPHFGASDLTIKPMTTGSPALGSIAGLNDHFRHCAAVIATKILCVPGARKDYGDLAAQLNNWATESGTSNALQLSGDELRTYSRKQPRPLIAHVVDKLHAAARTGGHHHDTTIQDVAKDLCHDPSQVNQKISSDVAVVLDLLRTIHRRFSEVFRVCNP